MDVVADTNILIRSVHRKAPTHHEALHALRVLRERGDQVWVLAQNLYEFWSVATRPIENNGLGLTPTQAEKITSRIEELCGVLRDSPGIYDVWRQLVVNHAVSGKKAHDARLVAAMRVHGVTHILTFNVEDFARYWEIQALHPGQVLAQRK